MGANIAQRNAYNLRYRHTPLPMLTQYGKNANDFRENHAEEGAEDVGIWVASRVMRRHHWTELVGIARENDKTGSVASSNT